MNAFFEFLVNLLTSQGFRTFSALCGIAIVLFLLVRLYLRLRTAHLGNIEYERTFSETGVYEGEEVDRKSVV